jgi:5'-methylthioadenosine phosphorylase
MSEQRARLGILGGSSLYAFGDLEDRTTVEMTTPFGAPSDAITLGTLAGERIAFVPRHGRGHRYHPTAIPVRANI